MINIENTIPLANTFLTSELALYVLIILGVFSIFPSVSTHLEITGLAFPANLVN